MDFIRKFFLLTMFAPLLLTALPNWAGSTDNRTNVELVDFIVSPYDLDILVEWETASELDNSGFRVMRSLSATGTYSQVYYTPTTAPDPLSGDVYEFLDEEVDPNIPYYYKLEAIDINNNVQTFGPETATVVVAGAATSTPTPTLTGSPGTGATQTPTPTATQTATQQQSGATATNTWTPTTNPYPNGATFTPAPSLTRTLSPTPSRTPVSGGGGGAASSPTSAPSATTPPGGPPLPGSTPSPAATIAGGGTVTDTLGGPTATLPALDDLPLAFPVELSPTPKAEARAAVAEPIQPAPPTLLEQLAMEQVELNNRLKLLGAAVAGLWLMLGAILFFYLQRNRISE